jgi:hypothetical protein
MLDSNSRFSYDGTTYQNNKGATWALLAEEAEMAATGKSMATRLETLRKQQASYAALVSEPEEKRIYSGLQKTLEEYLAQSGKLTTLSHAGQKDEARILFRGGSNKLYRQANEQLDALIKINDDGSSAADQSATATFALSRQLIIAMLLAVMVVAVVMALWVARRVADAFAARHERQPAAGGGPGAQRHRCDRHGVGRNRQRQPGPVGPHRGPGQLAGADRVGDGGVDLDGAAERR